MKEKQYIKQLEVGFFDLVTMITNQALYSLLSADERKQVISVLKKTATAKARYSN